MRDRIVEFYACEGTDDLGRTLDTILGFDDLQLEATHNFIQWLFPMFVPSPVNPSAPIVDKTTQKDFRNVPDLKANLCAACRRMLRFYGLECETLCPPSNLIRPDGTFSSKAMSWLSPNNHNHLRLTRIMTSLRLLDLPVCSQQLCECLIDIAHRFPDQITRETLGFWRRSQGLDRR
jgi:hypothetical protein